MQILLKDMPLFVEVAKLKSFTKASESLNLGISTLSRRISLLEKAIGASLFSRNTRNVELTASGKMLLERCEFILAETNNAYESISRNMQSPSGELRISMFDDVYYGILQGVLSTFIAQWPKISLRVNFSTRPVDLYAEPYDIVFKIGPLPDTTLVARKICTIDTGIYASRKLLEVYPAPGAPQDLTKMPCICLDRIGNTWELHNGRQHVNIAVRPAFSFSSISLCREFALAGHGVTMMRKLFAYPSLENGELLRLLPEWSGVKHDIFVLRHPGQPPGRVRVFVDYLTNYFSKITV
jgi:DNA-binding transcriptional LysR family regulator